MMRRMKIKAAPILKVPTKKAKLTSNHSPKPVLKPVDKNCDADYSSEETVIHSNNILTNEKTNVNISTDISDTSTKKVGLVTPTEKSSPITTSKVSIDNEVIENSGKSETQNGDLNKSNDIVKVLITDPEVNSPENKDTNVEILRNEKLHESKKLKKVNKVTVSKKPEKKNDSIIKILHEDNSKNEMIDETSTEKKKFLERKHQFKQKLIDGNLERSKITMFDLIYWNPPENPLPNQTKNDRKKRKHSVADSFISETEEELRVEEQNLEVEKKKPKKDSVAVPDPDEKENVAKKNIVDTENSENEEAESTQAMLAPKVKIGPDGELVIDEKSLVVQTTAAKDRNKILSSTEVIEESKDSSHYGNWSKRRKRAPEWTKKETARFYKALSTVGTDFSLMSTVFAWRTRAELKIKFKKEERHNKHLIDIALNDCTQFDFSIFEESDYDPVADRQETKEHERNETMRKKEEEKLKKQAERIEEKKKKLEQKQIDKNRKKVLREVRQSLKKQKKGPKISSLPPPVTHFGEDSNESNATSTSVSSVVVEAEEVVCELVLTSPNKNCRSEGFVTQHNQDEPEEDIDKSLYLDTFRVSEENSYVTVAKTDTGAESSDQISTDVIPVDGLSTEYIDNGANQTFLVPVSMVQKNSDGSSYIDIETVKGIKNVPVPPLLPNTTNVVVMAMPDPQDASEQIFHVYAVAPIDNAVQDLNQVASSPEVLNNLQENSSVTINSTTENKTCIKISNPLVSSGTSIPISCVNKSKSNLVDSSAQDVSNDFSSDKNS